MYLDPMEVAGCSISPRELFISVVEPRLRPLPGETDLCIMANSVQGLKGGEAARVDHLLLAGPDQVAGVSAMARVTGSSAAVAARILGRGELRGRGIVAPEDGIRGAVYEGYLRELDLRGIFLLKTVRTGSEPFSRSIEGGGQGCSLGRPPSRVLSGANLSPCQD